MIVNSAKRVSVRARTLADICRRLRCSLFPTSPSFPYLRMAIHIFHKADASVPLITMSSQTNLLVYVQLSLDSLAVDIRVHVSL